ncbi:hypothetical protein AX15_004716 [Amanita polypyramis BW_CC]|nr:hypothetical protein AX15_004716 [Amanita polypyramis BW_CC]
MVLATSLKNTLLALSLDLTGYRIFQTVNTALEYTIYQIVDAILIYRCWIVYGRTGRIIFLPVFLWLSSVVFSSYNVYLYASKNKESSLTDKICDGFFACNIVINIYATTAIVYRIVRVTKGSVSRSKCLHRTWRIVAEAGVPYTTSTLINLTAIILTNRYPKYIPYALLEAAADPINVTMAGISFNLILIRVGQQRRQRTVDQGISMIQFHSAEVTESV